MAKCGIHPMTDLSTTGTCWACELDKHRPPEGWPTTIQAPALTVAATPCPECARLTKERDAALAGKAKAVDEVIRLTNERRKMAEDLQEAGIDLAGGLVVKLAQLLDERTAALSSLKSAEEEAGRLREALAKLTGYLRDPGRDAAATVGCRYVEHTQEICNCREIADLIDSALAEGGKP